MIRVFLLAIWVIVALIAKIDPESLPVMAGIGVFASLLVLAQGSAATQE